METILVVDDEKSVRITISELLKDHRFQVHLAENALEALEILRNSPVDLVISDIMMPRMKGTDLLETITNEFPQIKTILITGQASLENATASLRGGAFDYLEKPIMKHTLLSAVDNAFRIISLDRMNRKLMAENQKYREQLEELIHRKTEHLSRLSQRIVHVQDEERNRIAEEIDRSIGQSLYALKLGLQTELARMPTPEGRQTLDYLDEIIVRTRGLAEALNPIGISGTDLGLALTRVCEEIRERTGTTVELDLEPLPEMANVQTTGTISLIVREALTNALQHGQATKIRIEAEQDGTFVTISINDNGRGFTKVPRKSTEESGIGILLMQERAAALGGTLTIHSEPGHGTEVLLTLPVNAARI